MMVVVSHVRWYTLFRWYKDVIILFLISEYWTCSGLVLFKHLWLKHSKHSKSWAIRHRIRLLWTKWNRIIQIVVVPVYCIQFLIYFNFVHYVFITDKSTTWNVLIGSIIRQFKCPIWWYSQNVAKNLHTNSLLEYKIILLSNCFKF